MNASRAVRAGATAALAAGALFIGAFGAQAAGSLATPDTRATPATGSVGTCKDLGFDGDAYGVGIEGAKDPSGHVTTKGGQVGKDTALEIMKADQGVMTAAVVVDSIGYNFFHAGSTPDAMGDYPVKGLTGPVEKRGDKALPITGWYVCLAANGDSIGKTEKGIDRKTPMEMCPLGSALTPEALCTRPPGTEVAK